MLIAARPQGLLAGLAAAGAVLLGARPSARARLRRCLRPTENATLTGWWPWAASLIRPSTAGRANLPVPIPVVIDLVAAVVEAGAAPAGAVRMVAHCLTEAGDPAASELSSPGTAAQAWEPLFAALELAQTSGLGPVGLLRSTAAEQRRRRAEAMAVAARRLAVLAVLPTTLCLLPAFVLITVVPLIIGLVLG